MFLFKCSRRGTITANNDSIKKKLWFVYYNNIKEKDSKYIQVKRRRMVNATLGATVASITLLYG